MLTWDDLIFFRSVVFDEIVEELESQTRAGVSILPSPEDILNALKYTPFGEVKVVILGQDPYPDKSHAHGLAFSVPDGVHPYPASLKNIFRELQDDIGCPEPETGCLIPWAEQGVLLLNTALTVVEGQRGSHTKLGWNLLVNLAMREISEQHEGIVFILWGKKAQAKTTYISNKKTHLILRGAHPSPLAANKGGFFGTKPFSQTNEFLKQNGKPEIRWCLDRGKKLG